MSDLSFADMVSQLTEAVDALTLERIIPTSQIDDDRLGWWSKRWLHVHTEVHPPLLTLLIEGLGIPRRAGSSDVKIPVDAEALELWAQIRDQVRAWSSGFSPFTSDNLILSTRLWFHAFVNRVRDGRVGFEQEQDVLHTVESWVRMIEGKYDRDEILEWKDRCVAQLPDGSWCHARRILMGEVENFAIEINVTKQVATCRACGTEWVGFAQMAELRFLTNLDNMISAGLELDQAARNLLANM